jgi:hypothetical protein
MNAGICMGDRPVVAWTVVIKPSMIPNSSWTTWEMNLQEIKGC